MMNRRETLIAFPALLAAPLAALGQAKPRRIGFLGTGSASAMTKPIEALRTALRELGYVEGRNLVIEYRWGDGDAERLPGLAEDLIRLKVELIVVWATPAALAAKRATASLPIVTLSVADPVSTGLIASLARPGGNVTGMANLTETVTSKQLELLARVVPGISRVAILRYPDNPALAPQVKSAEATARPLGLQLQIVDVRAVKDFDAAFAAMREARTGGVLVLADALFLSERVRIAELAAKHRLPTAFGRAENVEAGGLMSYGSSVTEQFRRGAVYVDKILKGAKPADLPVEQASTFEFVVNLKTAKALGIQFPQQLLVRADRVIE
jgi:putative ABC transport system substrate-binding protein